jgi:hypothetical protein
MTVKSAALLMVRGGVFEKVSVFVGSLVLFMVPKFWAESQISYRTRRAR